MLALLLGVAFSLQQGPVEVEVAASDRAAVRGTLAADKFTLETEFGTAVVKAQKLGKITFGAPDVVVTDAGVELKGKLLQLESLDVKVAGKSQRIPRKALQSLVVLRGGKPIGGSDWGITWMTTFGPLELKQQGATVTGRLGHDGGCKVEGKVDGKALVVKWDHSGDTGGGRLEIWDDGSGFSGTRDWDGKNESFWGGYRKEAKKPQPKPGEIVAGQCENGVRCFVRAPKSWDAQKPAKLPAICILHGSNMTSRDYVATIASAWPKLADEYWVVGVDGETLAKSSEPGELRCNYTYINFSGPRVGPAWVFRQSPALVAEALQELGKHLGVDRWFLGGHSQGGFLTNCLVTYYPELLAGAFPMSCNLLVQCEPDNFDAAARKKQHAVAVAVIHGKADTVVPFSGGAYQHLRYRDGGTPALRLFAPEGIAHQFALLPVEEAVRWLAAIRDTDGPRLLAFARERAKGAAWRDVGAAIRWAEANGLEAAGFGELGKQLDAACAAKAAALEKRMEQDSPEWVDDFLALRAEFAFAPCLEPLLARYGELRRGQQKAADKLFFAARELRDKDAREAKYRELLASGWATKWYECVKLWLSD